MILGIFALGYLIPKPTAQSKPTERPETKLTSKTDNFNVDSMRVALREIKIKYPTVAEAQTRLETGNYSSPIYKENNNLFGMKMPEKRPTMATGINRGHAVFKDWRKSVTDYAMFQSRALSKVNCLEEWYDYLDAHYSELPKGEYKKLLKKIVSEIQEETK